MKVIHAINVHNCYGDVLWRPLTSGEVPTVTFALLTMSLMMQGCRVAMVSSNVAPVSEYTSRANSVTCVIWRGWEGGEVEGREGV